MIDLYALVKDFNAIYQRNYYKVTGKTLVKRYAEYLQEYFSLAKDSPLKLNLDLYDNSIIPFLEDHDLGMIDVDQLAGYLNREVIKSRLPKGVKVLKGGPIEGMLGPYLVVRELGAGAYGKVFLGEKGKKKYAIKEVPLSVKRLNDMVREIELLKAVSAVRPQIAPKFYEAFVDANLTNLYIVMEYINCGSLADWLKENQLTKAHLAQIKKLIGALHRHGVYHRDLHQENVLVKCSARGAPQFLISDFGLSKEITDLESHNYELVGELDKEGLIESTILRTSPSTMIKELIVRELIRDS